MSVSGYLIENRHVGAKRCKHGIMAFNRNDSFIGASLDAYGEWCEFEISLMRQFIKPGDVVIDVGANIGTHTVAFANLVGPSGVVQAFEPQPRLYQMLCANLALNGIEHVLTEHAVVGDALKPISISELPPSDTYFNFGAMPIRGAATITRTVNLDISGVQNPRLIKIDVEGMEIDVIRGAGDLISRSLPVIYLENNGEDNAGIMTALRGIGYEAYWSIAPYFNPANFYGNTVNIWSQTYPGVVPSMNLIAFPVVDGRKMPDLPLPKFLGEGDDWRAALGRMRNQN